MKKDKTPKDFDKSVARYFKDISKTKPLSYAEEYDLWYQYRYNNDLNARNKLVTANLKFVANVAKNYVGRGLSFSDLIAEGNVGLIKAMDRFDARKGFKSISYSVWWIKQSILDALNRRNTMDTEDLPYNVDREEDDGEENMNGDSEKMCSEAFMDTFSDEEKEGIEQRKIIEVLFRELSDREIEMVSKRFGLFGERQKNLEEIGNDFGITKERTRQLLEKAFKKLRNAALMENLDKSVCFVES